MVLKKAGFTSWFKESMTQISNTYGSGKDRPKTSDDIACDSVVEYANELEKSLEVVHNNLETLIKARKEESKAWYELGLSFQLLGCYEKKQDEEKVGVLASEFGSVCDVISDKLSKSSDEDNIKFRELIKIQLRTAQALQEMMKARASQNVTYQAALNTLESYQNKLSKNTKEDKKVKLETSINEQEKVVEAEKAV